MTLSREKSRIVARFRRRAGSYDAAAQELISATAHLAFPIRNGIPIMIASEARELE